MYLRSTRRVEPQREQVKKLEPDIRGRSRWPNGVEYTTKAAVSTNSRMATTIRNAFISLPMLGFGHIRKGIADRAQCSTPTGHSLDPTAMTRQFESGERFFWLDATD